MTDLQRIEGIIRFMMTSIGSKSEGLRPFIISKDGEQSKVRFKGDNPFENGSLLPYNEKNVIAYGSSNTKKTFIIETIELIENGSE